MKAWIAVPVLAAAIVATTGCDIVTADLRAEESTQWHKSYTLDARGHLEIHNVNGKIFVAPSTGNTVDVSATKKARGASPEAAKSALDAVSIAEDVSDGNIRIDTKTPRHGGFSFLSGSVTVEYHVQVPAGADVKFTTVNGGVEVSGLTGSVVAESTNGGVTARNVSGRLEASTTNGGLEIDLARMPDGGVKLECVNGGIKVQLPRDAKATISASITNGGVSADNLAITALGEQSRRHLEGQLNGGGPRLEAEGVNGGIKLIGR
jgi:formylmethanofuran dehydrogenase subunit C